MNHAEKMAYSAFKEANKLSNPGFFELYLDYAGVGHSESPTIYHRWACVSMLGALLGRQAYMPFGHSFIYPNSYIMLMGSPGARKSTAINISKSLLKETGYSRFGPDKSSKEQFLSEMRQMDDDETVEDIEALCLDDPAEVYVVAGEFTDFIGQNNMDFITLLTNLWDCPDEYKNPKRTAKHVNVVKPTVNIIGGNTPQGFSLAFPPESMGNGFMSRLIMVHGDPTGTKIAWPEPVDPLVKATLAEYLKEMKDKVKGEFTRGKGVDKLGAQMYEEAIPVDDTRFLHYSSRRFTHLLKLAMVLAAADLSMVITEEHMLKANTLLYYTERKMPKALGEFGKGKNSDVSNKVLDILNNATDPVTIRQIFKAVRTDINNITDVATILKSLQQAEKIQQVAHKNETGYLPKHEESKEWNPTLIYPDWLTEEEKA